jgi:hypothetical protein
MDENLISMVDILCLILARNCFVKKVAWQGTLSYKCILNEVFGIPCCLQESFRPVFPPPEPSKGSLHVRRLPRAIFCPRYQDSEKNLTLNYL